METGLTLSFLVLATVTLAGAVAAISFQNLVHCALALALCFMGIAGLYLQLNAQFVGFAQILVYVGAVAILIVFAILLTRGTDPEQKRFSTSWAAGAGATVLVFAVLGWAIAHSGLARGTAPAEPVATARAIGEQLMSHYILPLEVLGLLLTAALIGAVILALEERRHD